MGQKENRKLKRWQLIYSLRVFESASHQLFGYLSDISDNGMSLVTEKAIPVNRGMRLSMEVRQQNSEILPVELDARSVWVNQDEETGLYRAGFELSGLDPLLVTSVRCIIDELKLEA
ncbi:MAG: PilZ domain-containing protein [Gammaproteobacteria bacterium]|nr:PilZ domain-containing protein [Gammaproteobacteria bacterium]